MPLDLQYQLANLTPADASPVEANFDRVEQYINTEIIDRAGTTAMTGQLKLIGDPVAALDAAPKQYVDNFMPVGSITMYAGDVAPVGGKWALCNGADMDSALFPTLYNLIGNKYGGTGGHFNLPNLAGKFPLGVSSADVLGATGGSRDAVVVDHSHPIDHTHGAGTTGNDSPDHSHNDDHQHSGATASMNRNAVHHHDINGIDSAGTPGGLTTSVMTPFGTVKSSTLDTNTDHEHAFTTNYKSQQPGQTVNTTGASVRHAHSFQTPSHTGASGAATTAVAPTNANLPPYLVVNFIIRVA